MPGERLATLLTVTRHVCRGKDFELELADTIGLATGPIYGR